MGISKGTMVAATRREAWFLLLSLILGVQAMPMSLDSGAQVFLAEVASQDPGTGELNCHTKTDQSDKLACCKHQICKMYWNRRLPRNSMQPRLQSKQRNQHLQQAHRQTRMLKLLSGMSNTMYSSRRSQQLTICTT